MLISEIKKQLFARIKDLRDMDIAVVLDLFLASHKIQGVNKNTTLDLVNFDLLTNSIPLDSNISEVSSVFVNDEVIPRVEYVEISIYTSQAYSVGEDGNLYFVNPLIDHTDTLKVYGKSSGSTLADYENKWKDTCVRYCLKELYLMPSYFNAELFKINKMEYDKAVRLVGGVSREKPRMNFMRKAL